MSQPAPFALNYRDITIAVLIVLLAFALRVIVVFDRAYHDWAFDPLPSGRDQDGYVKAAEGYEAGLWPREPFYWQPGIIYYLIGVRAAVGKSLGVMRLAASLTGALTCGLLIGAGWLLTGRKWGGYLAGALLALYPAAIFWSTDFLDPVLSSFYVGLFLFLALWQKEALKLWRTAGLGVVVGLLTITRSNLTLIALSWLAYLAVIAPDRRTFAVHALAFGITAMLTVAPVTLWNIQSGARFQLVSSAGLDEVYRGNNRDANGLRSDNPAMDVADDYGLLLAADIARDPRRFVELELHKVGLYWSNHESGNNLDYVQNGEAASPLLRAIPLDFRILSALGLVGLFVLLRDDRRQGLFLVLVNLLIFAGVMPLWIEGRMRQPAVAPLALTAGYFVLRLPGIVGGRQWRILVAPAVFVLALFAFSEWAIANLPRHYPVSSLPPDVRRVDVVFDGKVRFVGWRPLPEWTAPAWGWGTANNAYVVELFWELLEPADKDYNFYMAYVQNGKRYAARDRLIGGISFPPHPTSTWQPGDTYSEIAGFRLAAGHTIPTERSGEIQVGVYLWDEQGKIRSVPATNLPDHADYVVLQPFAVIDLSHADSPPQGMVASDLVFGSAGGDQMALRGFTLPSEGEPGQDITLSFYWQALDDVRENYNLFIHVMDANGELAAQHDGPPRDGAFLTSTWPHAVPVRQDVEMKLPDAPGVYRVYFGLYHAQTHDRLPVDAPDNRPLLGEITVK